MIRDCKTSQALKVYLPIIIIGAVLFVLGWSAGAIDGKVLYETDSQYHHICITETPEGYRYLTFERNRGEQSAVRLNHPEDLYFKYTQMSLVSFSFFPQIPKDILIVGLGGGSIPMFMRHFFPQVNIDIAEIDPEVVKASGDYFGFKPDDRMKVSNLDGRVYLRRNDRAYDLIFLDAYDSDTIPFHLTTREFLELVKTRLKPGGIVAANIWAPDVNKFYAAEVATYRDVFKEVYLFQAKGSGNYIFVAERDGRVFNREDLMPRAKAIMDEYRLPYDITIKIRDNYDRVNPEMATAEVLTDDHAPVDLLKQQSAQSTP